jgi:hypothetical protein
MQANHREKATEVTFQDALFIRSRLGKASLRSNTLQNLRNFTPSDPAPLHAGHPR